MLLMFKRVLSLESIKKIIIILLAILIATITTSFRLREAHGATAASGGREDELRESIAKQLAELKGIREAKKAMDETLKNLEKTPEKKESTGDKDKACEESKSLRSELVDVFKAVSNRLEAIETEIAISKKHEKEMEDLKERAKLFISEMGRTNPQLLRQMVMGITVSKPMLEAKKADLEEKLKNADDKDKEDIQKELDSVNKILNNEKAVLAALKDFGLQGNDVGRATRFPVGQMTAPDMPRGTFEGDMRFPGQFPPHGMPGGMPGQPMPVPPQMMAQDPNAVIKNVVSQGFSTVSAHLNRINNRNQLGGQPSLGPQPNPFNNGGPGRGERQSIWAPDFLG